MSLSSAYNRHRHAGAKLKKTFDMPLDVIVCDNGLNIRQLDEDHVTALAAAYQRGDEVPPIYVVMEDGFPLVVDGHHRYAAAVKAGLSVLECKEFKGGAVDRLVFQIQSAGGKALTFLEKALAMHKMMSSGLTSDDIANRMGVSRTDVANKLLLAEADPEIHKLVEEGKLSATNAVDYLVQHGVDALARIQFDLEKVNKTGGTRITAGTTKKAFSTAKMRAVLELLAKGLEYNARDLQGEGLHSMEIELTVEECKELITHVEDYCEHAGIEKE